MRRLIALAILLGVLRGAAANTPANYAYVFPIETTNAPGENSAWRIELTPDAYRWIEDAQLGDVEIFNAEQRPVPFARYVAEPAATTSENAAPLPLLALPASAKAAGASDLRLVIDRDADGRLRRIDAGEKSAAPASSTDWLLDASAFDRPIDRLELRWNAPRAGVVARFSVEASDDLQSWRAAGGATVLELEQGGARLERHDIPLGGVRTRYLRLRRLDDGVALDGLAVGAVVVEHGRAAPSRVWIDATPAEHAPETATRPGRTAFEYTLPARLPVDRARIELASDNALAAIELLGFAPESTANPWVHLGGETAFRLRQNDETLRNGEIEVRSVVRMERFRIETQNAIAAPHLSLGYRPDDLVFLAEGSGPFVLAAGSAQARHAEYPVELALASIRAKAGKDWQPPLAKLGAAKPGGGEAVLKAAPPPLPWRRWLLWAILVGGALMIAVLAINLLRGAKPPP
jgi:hypothetical protein